MSLNILLTIIYSLTMLPIGCFQQAAIEYARCPSLANLGVIGAGRRAFVGSSAATTFVLQTVQFCQ